MEPIRIAGQALSGPYRFECGEDRCRGMPSGGFMRIFDNVFYGGFKYHPKLRLAREMQTRDCETLNVGANHDLSERCG